MQRPPSQLRPFTAAMAAGILSVAAALQGQRLASDVLLASAIAALAFVGARNLRPLGAWRSAAGKRGGAGPSVALLTWVAACGVLSGRAAALVPVARYPLAALAVIGLAAVVPVLAGRLRRHRAEGLTLAAGGTWLLATVALQSGSILATSGGRDLGLPPVFEAGALLWPAGVVVYAVVIALIVRRIVLREVRPETFTPDYWIALGALAISAVAALTAAQAPPAIDAMPGGWGLWTAAAFVAWLFALAWLPYLCLMEGMKLRTGTLGLGHDPQRWATVFPLGMTSVATAMLGHALHVPLAIVAAGLFFWAGLAVALANAGMLAFDWWRSVRSGPTVAV